MLLAGGEIISAKAGGKKDSNDYTPNLHEWRQAKNLFYANPLGERV